jgi:hypothetical protein
MLVIYNIGKKVTILYEGKEYGPMDIQCTDDNVRDTVSKALIDSGNVKKRHRGGDDSFESCELTTSKGTIVLGYASFKDGDTLRFDTPLNIISANEWREIDVENLLISIRTINKADFLGHFVDKDAMTSQFPPVSAKCESLKTELSDLSREALDTYRRTTNQESVMTSVFLHHPVVKTLLLMKTHPTHEAAVDAFVFQLLWGARFGEGQIPIDFVLYLPMIVIIDKL